MKEKKLKTFLVASPLPAEGTSTVLVNLGTFLADKTKRRVLLIDANLRHPSLHTLLKSFNVTNTSGLADVLEERKPFDEAVQQAGKHLSVLTAGSTQSNPLTLLGLSGMSDLLQRARMEYDAVLVDGPAMSTYRDSLALTPLVDGVLLVIKEGNRSRQVLQVAMKPLNQLNGKLLGAVISHRTFAIPKVLYNWL